MTASPWGSAATFRQCVAEKASFVLLNHVDFVLTVIAASLGFSELNPVMRGLLTTPVQLVFIKCAIPVLIAWLIPGKLLLPAVIALALLVGWDVKELVICLL